MAVVQLLGVVFVAKSARRDDDEFDSPQKPKDADDVVSAALLLEPYGALQSCNLLGPPCGKHRWVVQLAATDSGWRPFMVLCCVHAGRQARVQRVSSLNFPRGDASVSWGWARRPAGFVLGGSAWFSCTVWLLQHIVDAEERRERGEGRGVLRERSLMECAPWTRTRAPWTWRAILSEWWPGNCREGMDDGLRSFAAFLLIAHTA